MANKDKVSAAEHDSSKVTVEYTITSAPVVGICNVLPVEGVLVCVCVCVRVCVHVGGWVGGWVCMYGCACACVQHWLVSALYTYYISYALASPYRNNPMVNKWLMYA